MKLWPNIWILNEPSPPHLAEFLTTLPLFFIKSVHRHFYFDTPMIFYLCFSTPWTHHLPFMISPFLTLCNIISSDSSHAISLSVNHLKFGCDFFKHLTWWATHFDISFIFNELCCYLCINFPVISICSSIRYTQLNKTKIFTFNFFHVFFLFNFFNKHLFSFHTFSFKTLFEAITNTLSTNFFFLEL